MSERILLSSAVYIEAQDITEEEKAQHEAKFKAWYEEFKRKYGVAK